MSVANSCVSLAPASTVVGCRDFGGRVDPDSTTAFPTATDGDEALKREVCAWFENALDIRKYLRDKKNDERADDDCQFVRINSKRLRCSYRIPAEETARFLKTLHGVLSPGFKADALRESAAVPLDEENKKCLKTLYDWMICSDLTAQVFPRAPTVLWLDMECMVCKNRNVGDDIGNQKKKMKHLRSKQIIEIVVGVVFSSVGVTCCDHLYVTRGKTCGMHLFFPQVVLHTEHDVQELWAAVNRSLSESNQPAAAVDTGCSAMPLPLARDHNGLTRVKITRNDSGDVVTHSYKIKNPSVRDLTRVTNFCHFASSDFRNDRPTKTTDTSLPPTTVADDDGVEENRCEKYEGDRNTDTVPPTRVLENNVPIDDVLVVEADGGEDVFSRVTDTAKKICNTSSSSSSVSSSSSSLSKRLRQTDIRAICAKAANDKKRKNTFPTEEDPSEVKRRRTELDGGPLEEPILLLTDEEDSCGERAEPSKDRGDDDRLSGLFAARRETNTNPTSALHGEENDDTVSSFLCTGYTPRSLLMKSMTATREDDDEPVLLNAADTENVVVASDRPTRSGGRENPSTLTLPIDRPLHALYVADDTPPSDARLPDMCFRVRPTDLHDDDKKDYLRNLARAAESFENSMRLQLDDRENQTHETDMQLILTSFNAEMGFYVSVFNDSTPVDTTESGGCGGPFDGLRLKRGCSLHETRESCPAAPFPEHVPFVLYTEDFVSETEWISVLVRYFDEYLNNAPVLYVMAHVLRYDENVKKHLSASSRDRIRQSVHNCLARYKYEAIGYQSREDARRQNGAKTINSPKHPYEEKCTVAVGLLAVCSLAFKLVTPVFTDLAKVCRSLLGNDQQTLDSLNSSTMPTAATAADSNDLSIFDSIGDLESASQAEEMSAEGGGDGEESWRRRGFYEETGGGRVSAANIGNDHSIIASVLRWNYAALSDQTLWCLFFYYYHVHADGLTRIMDEVVHGGLMVTALLQAYFECVANNAPIDVRTVCNQAYVIHDALTEVGGDRRGRDEDRSLMPPPQPNRRGVQRKRGGGTRGAGHTGAPNGNTRGDTTTPADKNNRHNSYKTNFNEVLSLIVHRYLRPVSFDETTVVYTEAGYEQCLVKEYSSFFSADKERKRTTMDVFSRSTLKYSMPHGDLLMYNTDVMGTVHRRSSCTNNLVLNIFENMYGGCMSYLTRRFNNHLKLFNRFNGDAYRLVVECRHAMIELVGSIGLSYVNLILRQPVVPPVLESDIGIRHMFMSEEEISKGAFVCLNAMDYVRSINMFTAHTKFSQEDCRVVESFLDSLITDRTLLFDSGHDGEACTRFRAVYLFYLLYVFEVLYKIRHAHSREGTYHMTIERLCWDLDVRVLVKLFFGRGEFRTPRGLSPETLKRLDLPTDGTAAETVNDDDDDMAGGNSSARCIINTRPLISADLPDKMKRMVELFGKKGIAVMKSYVPLCDRSDNDTLQQQQSQPEASESVVTAEESILNSDDRHGRRYRRSRHGESSCNELDRAFLNMNQSQLEEALYASAEWYDNCRVRVQAVKLENLEANDADKRPPNALETCMDAVSIGTFLRTQLRVHIDNGRLNRIERAVREKRDFAFCTDLPLRAKMTALVLATHSAKRLTTDVAADFVHKEYRLERSGAVRFAAAGSDEDGECRPDREWASTWKRLLGERKGLLAHCRSLADTYFPHNYFVGLEPENAYSALYNYMLGKPKYVTLQALHDRPWAKDVCAAINYLLVINAYDPELVELCLRLFLGFEWPGQWAKRIFVWKSNSNAGKSFFFEHIIRKAFDQSTCINDPKGGKENAPEKSEYYKNFVLTINEFTSASAGELKKLCSTSSYKFRMNFGNQMIQAFAVGKMVFNCNTLPLTTDHATIQRVALVPLPFWFQKRQTVVDAMLNWTRGHQSPLNDYEKNFRRNISQVLTAPERRFFIENRSTKNEDDLFNRPNENSLRLLGELGDRNARASMFLVQNKTSQVYMLSAPPTGTIISGIVLITRYFCRFRFFNNIKEPVDYSVLPTACNVAAQEWQRISQPYFDWKERYRVQKDYSTRTKVSAVHASLNHFAKNYSKNASFFDLRQFFEWDFAEQKIPYYNAKEDEYNVRLDPLQD